MGVVVLLQVSVTNDSNIDCGSVGSDAIQFHRRVPPFQTNMLPPSSG